MRRSFVISPEASPPPDPDRRGRVAAPSPPLKPPTEESKIKSRRNRRNADVRLARKNSGNGEGYPIFGE
jgi:hypothetical protein